MPAEACFERGPWIQPVAMGHFQAWCNRPAGHDGPHRMHDAKTMKVLEEWPTRDISGFSTTNEETK